MSPYILHILYLRACYFVFLTQSARPFDIYTYNHYSWNRYHDFYNSCNYSL